MDVEAYNNAGVVLQVANARPGHGDIAPSESSGRAD